MKLTDKINPDVHAFMVKGFNGYTKTTVSTDKQADP